MDTTTNSMNGHTIESSDVELENAGQTATNQVGTQIGADVGEADVQAEKIPAVTSVLVPIEMLLAAIACSSEDETRPALNGVHLHSVDNQLRVVATDGHRLFIGTTTPQNDELPAWLTPGVTIKGDSLKAILKMILGLSGVALAKISFALGAAHVEIADIGSSCLFNRPFIDLKYPDYQMIVGQTAKDLEGAEVGDFQSVGFNSAYLKEVGDIAKVLNSEQVSVYGKSPTAPTVFTFGSYDGAVLYLMPHKVPAQISPNNAAILDPAIKGTLAALRAHQTRNEVARDEAKTEAERQRYAEKVESYQERIAALMERVTVAALPAPEPEAEAEAETGETAGEAEAEAESKGSEVEAGEDAGGEEQPEEQPAGDQPEEQPSGGETDEQSEQQPDGEGAEQQETSEDDQQSEAAGEAGGEAEQIATGGDAAAAIAELDGGDKTSPAEANGTDFALKANPDPIDASKPSKPKMSKRQQARAARKAKAGKPGLVKTPAEAAE